MLGGMQLKVDGEPVKVSEAMNFRGTMLSNVPNFATVFGYTNASWTLKSDLACLYFSRLIGYMDRNGYAVCTPRQRDPSVKPERPIDLTSGYFQRSIDKLPRQGSKKPWRLYQNYLLDFVSLRFGGVNDKALEFSRGDKSKIAA
jgi:monooxygenase